jgi:hypothetical protein
VVEPAGDSTASVLAPWRSIDDLAVLVGTYCWLEHRLFELTGRWATEPGDRDRAEVAGDVAIGDGAIGDVAVGAECRVWCAASSRRHGALAGRWAERLPVRAGVDAAALVRAPGGPLAPALEKLAAEEVNRGFGLLVETVLPWVGGVYATHLSRTSPVSEAPVIEVLLEARRAAVGELRGGRSLLRRLPAGSPPSRHIRQPLERALAESGILPAVPPS